MNNFAKKEQRAANWVNEDASQLPDALVPEQVNSAEMDESQPSLMIKKVPLENLCFW